MARTELPTRRKRPAERLKNGTPSLIYLHRTRKGLSPERFGAMVGVSGMTIRRIEDGRAKASSLHPRTKFLIAKHMGMPVEELWPL